MKNNRLAWWAIAIAKPLVVLLVISGTIFAVAFISGGNSAISDNWVGFLGAIAILGGLLVSFVAFVLAITARFKHGHSAWLWLPLTIFPVLLAFIVIGETFWWQ